MKRSIALLFTVLILISLCGCVNEHKYIPQITDGEFAFTIEYDYNGKRYKYEDVVVCNYVGLGDVQGYSNPERVRCWESKLKSSGEDYRDILIVEEYGTKSLFDKDRTNACSFLYLGFGRAYYYMGEKKYSNIDVPCFYYYESFKNPNGTQSEKATALTQEQVSKYFGIEVIEFNVSSPIKNEYN